MIKRSFVALCLAGMMAAGTGSVAWAQSTQPYVPASVSATLSGGQATVSWAAPTILPSLAIAGYYVYRDGVMVNNTAGTSFIDNLTSAGIYTYTVAAYDTAGTVYPQSAPTSPITIIVDTTPPSAPSGLNVTSLASTSVALSWGAASDNVGVVGYYVLRNGSRIPTGILTGTSFTDTDLNADAALTYQVQAYDAAGNISNGSNVVHVTTLPGFFTITTPYNVSAAAVSMSEIDVSWGASVDASGTPIYYIFRDGNPYATTTATSFADTGLTPGTSHNYSIEGFDARGAVSSRTDTAGASTFPAPAAPAASTTPVVPVSPVLPVVPTPPATPAPTTAFTTLLYLGMRTPQVLNLQDILIIQGDLGASYATGYYGALTQKAVQKFQCAQNIVCSGTPGTTGWGLVGAKTRRALNAL